MTQAPLHAERGEPIARVDPDTLPLALEHRRFARHLAAVEVTDYQTGKYIAFHRARPLRYRGAFDALLMAVARSGTLGLLLADAYSGTLYPVCVLRTKLMLTLAILECSAPSFSVLDAPARSGRVAYLHMACVVFKAALVLACACAVLGPVHLVLALAAPSRRPDP